LKGGIKVLNSFKTDSQNTGKKEMSCLGIDKFFFNLKTKKMNINKKTTIIERMN
jgi:hypothetical protein